MTNYPTISWLVDKRIILVEYPPDYNEDDLEATKSARPVLDMLDEGEGALVHTIQDFTRVNSFQITRLNKLVEVNKSPGRVELYSHPKLGWIIDVAALDHPIRYLDHIVTQLFKARHRAVTTRAEALSFLRTVDQTLPGA